MAKINTNFIPSASNAFIVGGTVRDIILGVNPKDYDIVTFDDPKKLALQIAANTSGKVVELGKPGVRIFRVITCDRTYDVASANGTFIEDDLASRDFTVNAMAIAPDGAIDSGRIIDPHNGAKDLKNGVIRMVLAANLQKDPVRMLRAFRIAAFLKFSIDPETFHAISRIAPMVWDSAGERIKDELTQLFTTPNSYRYIKMMDEAGLLTAIFPELLPLKKCSQNIYHQFDAFEHTLKAYKFLEQLLHAPDSFTPDIINLKSLLPAEKNVALLKYTILIHDIGKPDARSIDPDGRIHFYRHEKISADMAVAINRRLRLSNREQDTVDFIIRRHLRPLSLLNAFKQNRLSQKMISRFFLKSDPLIKEVLIHSAADLYGKGIKKNISEFNKFLNYMIQQYRVSFLPKKDVPPLLNGNDLIREFGLTPSPFFSKILRHIEEERFAENIATRREAIDEVKKFLNHHNLS